MEVANGTYFAEASVKIVEDLENMALTVRGLSQLHSEILSCVSSKIGATSIAEIEAQCLLSRGLPITPIGIKVPPHTPGRRRSLQAKRQWKALPEKSSETGKIYGPKLYTPRIATQPGNLAVSEVPELDTGSTYVSQTKSRETLATKSKALLHNSWAETDEQTIVQYLDFVKTSRPNFNTKSSFMNRSGLSGALKRRTGLQSASSTMTGASSSTNRMASLYSEEIKTCSWIISPFSTQRLLWDIASVLFVLDDVFMVPLQVFEEPEWKSVTQYISRLFWVIDIVMSFRTSFFNGFSLESDPSAVASHYIRTSFPLDVALVLIQWLQLLNGTHVLFDTTQVLRLLRVGRLSQLKKAVVERSNSNHIHLYLDSAKIAVFCLVAMHLIACGWYWIGENIKNGWTHDDHMEGADLWYSYFFSARWTVAQVSGRTDLEARTTTEYIYTCFAAIFGFIIQSMIISTITFLMIELTALDRERLTRVHALNTYLKKNRVSPFTARHAKTGLEAEQKAMMNLERDREVLRVLPREVRADLLYEIHEQLLTRHQLFLDLNTEFPRMLRSICAEVVKQTLVHENDVLFATGDHCTCLQFLATGQLLYVWNKRAARVQTRKSEIQRRTIAQTMQTEDVALLGDTVLPKQWVSEAALWVEWINQGELTAISGSSLVSLEVHEFIVVVKKFRDARARATLYAKAFATKLARMDKPSDLLDPIRFYLPTEGQEVVLQTMEIDSNASPSSSMHLSRG